MSQLTLDCVFLAIFAFYSIIFHHVLRRLNRTVAALAALRAGIELHCSHDGQHVPHATKGDLDALTRSTKADWRKVAKRVQALEDATPGSRIGFTTPKA